VPAEDEVVWMQVLAPHRQPLVTPTVCRPSNWSHMMLSVTKVCLDWQLSFGSGQSPCHAKAQGPASLFAGLHNHRLDACMDVRWLVHTERGHRVL
jgi:hypothetical protein